MRRVLRRSLLYLLVTVLAFLFAAPMAWFVLSSLKPEAEIFTIPPKFFPSRYEWQNYPFALAQFDFFGSLGNTLFIIVAVFVGATLTASMAAYAFARLRFKFREALFVVVLSTMMIPGFVLIIPQYVIFKELGWLNSLKPLTIPAFFGGGAFTIFMLRQFFMTIPRDYDDAARIDGAGLFGIYWRIIMPLSTPVLGVVAINTFMAGWNDFFGPLIYINSPSKHTLTLAYMNWRRGMQHVGYRKTWSHIMAVGVVLTIPPILVFFFAQRYFIQGIVVTGIKG
jgi:ABC-type glycerol-3-phosphate transport system permease component